MNAVVTPLQAAVNAPPPHHWMPEEERELGPEIGLVEWLDAQTRVACRATLELLRSPRQNEEEMRLGIRPRIHPEKEEIASHLARVHQSGMYRERESYKALSKNPEVHAIITDWLDHFGALFNILAKQYQVPYEVTESHLHMFQTRLVEHVQHMRGIWEDHGGGTLSSGKAWQSMEWAEPRLIVEEGIPFARQVVYLPHVVGYGAETQLLLDGERFARESLMFCVQPTGVHSIQTQPEANTHVA